MNKIKTLLSILLTLALLLTLTACGGGDDEGESADPGESQSGETGETGGEQPPEDLSGWLGTKTGRFYSRFATGAMTMTYEIEMEGQVMTMTTMSDGSGKTYTETAVGGTVLSASLMEGETMYVIDHSSKMVIKMALQADAETIAGEVLGEGDLDMGSFKTGSREVDGKTYDTEEWLMEGVTAVYCFDGDDLIYMISALDGIESVMKIVEASDKVDSAKFTIPADYTLMEM